MEEALPVLAAHIAIEFVRLRKPKKRGTQRYRKKINFYRTRARRYLIYNNYEIAIICRVLTVHRGAHLVAGKVR